MTIFISHNKADKGFSRLLASSLVQQGVNVWFDEWDINPGDSIVSSVEKGLSEAVIFLLIWSKDAAKSNWVNIETNSFIHKILNKKSLKIIPLMIDDTPLPELVQDFKGIMYSKELSFDDIASQISGNKPDREVSRLLQNRLLEMVSAQNLIDPLPYLVCPECGSENLDKQQQDDDENDRRYLVAWCLDCGWHDGTEI